MFKKHLHELLKMSLSSAPNQIKDWDYSQVVSEGIQDFLDFKVGVKDVNSIRIKYSAPSRLVKHVLKRCKKGGMSSLQFDIAYSAATSVKGRASKSLEYQLAETMETYYEIIRFQLLDKKFSLQKVDDAWYREHYDKFSACDFKCRNLSRFYHENQQMEISTLRCFILLANEMKWLDHRVKPTVPHPAEYNWGSLRPSGQDSRIRRWQYFERASEVRGFMQRIDVVESIIQLLKSGNSINYLLIYENFMLDNPFRNKFRPLIGLASVSQIIRRFREGKFSHPEYPDDEFYNMVNFISHVNDLDWIKENEDIAKFKRGGEKTDARKIRIKDKSSGQFKKS